MRLPKLSPHRLQTRILAAFVVVMAAVGVSSLLLVHVTSTSAVRKAVTDRVISGTRAFERVVELDWQRLMEGAPQLSADPAFRETASGADRGTLSPALAKHARRIGSSVMLLIDSDRRIVAGTLPAEIG